MKLPCNVDFEAWVDGRESVREFIEKNIDLCKPDRLYIANGTDKEYDDLCEQLVREGLFKPVLKRPRSFWCHTDPKDVARVEARTFICSKRKEDAGPTNNWVDPDEMKATLTKKFDGCMRGRTMYVAPFCMGPLDSAHAKIGIELTDSAYVVVNMSIMTYLGDQVMTRLRPGQFFVPCLHSVGHPLQPGEKDLAWPCNEEKYIVQFPEERLIWSFGSGYGGNALLNKKCFALRIASVLARDEGWLAEHMLVMGITNPEGEKHFIAAAFPSACGKTNLALMEPTLPGWKVEVIGDDIAWIKFGPDGRLYAVNGEAGFFGVAPGTSMKSCPNGMRSLNQHCIFTNTGYTADGDVWWEGMTPTVPEGVTTWLGVPYDGKGPVAHPNARFTAPVKNCPSTSPDFFSAQGVPLSAILFGGRRAGLVPVVYESLSWRHGVLLGSMVSSEITAAAEGQAGQLRHDPFAMLPFCGYNMADYFGHWIEMASLARDPSLLPKVFHVNWFRRDKDGKFMWPGYGDNSRVLKWILERVKGQGAAVETPIGFVPDVRAGAIDISGLNISDETMQKLTEVNSAAWVDEVAQMRKYLDMFGDRLPAKLVAEFDALRARVDKAASAPASA